jgi:argininosuccinate lyase
MKIEKSGAAHQRGLRLSKLHAEELVNIYAAHAQSDISRADDLLLINYAHTLMLHEQKIISTDDAVNILRCFSELEDAGIDRVIHIDPRAGDLSTHVEAHLISIIGPEIGGKIQTGRSRNDIYPTMTKMQIRHSILEIYEALVSLSDTLLALAEVYKTTILPGCTHHSQHAQPITLGFYFLGNVDVFTRDLHRLENCLERLNTCPMGAAALATTGFPLDRSRMSELLGFDRFHEHAYDAVSAKDFLLEYLFDLSMVVSDMGRIAENILYWNTFEFGMVELSDEYTSFSTIMPQKKNPVAVETIRAMVPIVTGKLFNAFGILKAEPWSNGRETTILDDDSFETGHLVRNLISLLCGVIRTLRIHDERMHDLAIRGFSTATELSDVLVRNFSFSFRTAHEIVGLTVRKAIDLGIDSSGITPEMIMESIEEHTGRRTIVDRDLVRNALDPRKNVAIRKLPGGTSFEEVARMIAARKLLLDEKRCFLVSRKSRLKEAERNLREKVGEIIGRR